MTLKPLKTKKCKICRVSFVPYKSLEQWCSPECGFKLFKQNQDKKASREYRQAKVKLKPRAQWLKEAQTIFNKFIRLRDDAEPCISCGRHHTGQYHAGHYRSVGSTPELRFNELNCHKQCSVCNNYLSGNAINYRINLVKKIGLEQVEWLESKHEPLHLSIEEIVEIKKKYSDKIKSHNSEV